MEQTQRQPLTSWYRLAYLVLGGALAALPIAGFSAPTPSVLSPFPAPFLFALWIFGHPEGLMLAVLLPVAFWLLSPQLARGGASIPVRGGVVLILAAVLSIIWTLVGYRYGATHQGALYARVVMTINIAVPLFLTILFWKNRSRPKYVRAFTYQWLLWALIGVYAFAYLGELL
jgi:hypothetical protein